MIMSTEEQVVGELSGQRTMNEARVAAIVQLWELHGMEVSTIAKRFGLLEQVVEVVLAQNSKIYRQEMRDKKRAEKEEARNLALAATSKRPPTRSPNPAPRPPLDVFAQQETLAAAEESDYAPVTSFISEEELAEAYEVVKALAVGAQDEKVRGKMAGRIIDEARGRLNKRREMIGSGSEERFTKQIVTNNLVVFNETLREVQNQKALLMARNGLKVPGVIQLPSEAAGQ